MLTSANSLSGDNTSSSGSSVNVIDEAYQICFNGEYACMNEGEKDKRYWERRRKNNAAAKRSRERRRQHDMELELQIQQLKLMNTTLHKELMALRKKMALSELLNDESQKYSRNINNSNTLRVTSPPDAIDDSLACRTESTMITTTQLMEALYNDESIITICPQNPIDLSYKLEENLSIFSTTTDNQSKQSQKRNTPVPFDQKYWDRRRRNNEAVRKCRQNKRAKIVHNQKMSNENSTQLQIKIESISNELEKIKSQIEKPDKSSFENTETKEIEIQQHLETKIMKWKTKLIKADQADKEMFMNNSFST